MDRHVQPIDRWKTRRSRALQMLQQEGIAGIRRRVEEKGFTGGLLFLKEKARFELCSAFERAWDRVHDVDTSGQIDLEHLEVIGTNRSLGYSVVSTSARTFRFLTRLFPTDRSKSTFVDVGCGKGRVVLLASQLGFKRVIGVEFSPWAARIASSNLGSFRGNRAGLYSCSIVQADALEYQLPNEPLVLYMCNPFRVELFQTFLLNLIETFERHKKPIRICLVGSVSASVEGAAESLMRSGKFELGQKGAAPYFADTYLPYKYYSFDLCQNQEF